MARRSTARTAGPLPTSTERRVAQPGDRVCGTCAEPNDPVRKFCRRCGANLATASIVPKVAPWWRRLVGGSGTKRGGGVRLGTVRTGAVAGGARKGLGGILKARTMLVGVLGALAGLGLIGYVAVPGVQSTVNAAIGGGPQQLIANLQRMLDPQTEIIRPKPTDIVADDVEGDHVAARVSDKGTNTEWQAKGETPSLRITFPLTTDLTHVIVVSGAAERFTELRRPQTLEFVFDDGTTRSITLRDEHDAQTFELEVEAIRSVTVRIVSTFGPDDAPVALSELEFYRPKP